MKEYIKREAIKYEQWAVGPLNAPLMVVRKETIDAIPAADVVERKRGEWIDTGFENSTGKIYRCSACNKTNNPNKKDVEMGRVKEKPDFCPNCGADMRGDGLGAER